MSCLNTSKAAVKDQIPAKFQKYIADVLASLVIKIMKLSVKVSTFSKECKIKLKSLLKKGSMTDLKNCRPILLLLEVPTTIDKSIHDQLENCLSNNGLFYKYQPGF